LNIKKFKYRNEWWNVNLNLGNIQNNSIKWININKLKNRCQFCINNHLTTFLLHIYSTNIEMQKNFYTLIFIILLPVIVNSTTENETIKEKYCKKCLKHKGERKLKCYNECSDLNILSYLNILSREETLNEIINNKKSITRFGDGEFSLIFNNKGIGFQKFDIEISKRLFDILNSDKKDLIIAIPRTFKYYQNNDYWKNYIENHKYNIIKSLDFNKVYGDAGITRFYWFQNNREEVINYINKLKLVWDKKDIIIIEGEKTRFGINNDLLNNTKSIQRILCPSKNAYEVYDKIYNESLKISKEKLILIALGPTATILAYDLHNAGYQAIDIGHADISYEWFLRNATQKIKIENKYVNEVKDGGKNIDDVTDKSYYDQILFKILN